MDAVDVAVAFVRHGMPGPPQKGNLACALAFHSVNRTAAQFILRSRCAGPKGAGHLQLGIVDVAVTPLRKTGQARSGSRVFSPLSRS